MRALAHVETISNIRPIPDADKIVVADVLGWSIVVSKDEFKVGDLAVYFEIDSFLNSEDQRFAFLEQRFTNWGKKRGMKLKTIKLKRQLSQGLLMPVSKFPEIVNPKEGDDVTELLKIEKWEPIEETRSNNGGGSYNPGRPFPTFIPKTDQERVQNKIKHINSHMDDTYEVTVKLDGSSMTVYTLNQQSPYFDLAFEMTQKRIKGGRWNRLLKFIHKAKKFFGLVKKPEFVAAVCSRNLQLKENDGSHFWEYVNKHSVIQKIHSADMNYAIQGELIGPGIQQNYEKVQEPEFYVYDIYNIDKGEYLAPVQVRQYCDQVGLNHVPVLGTDVSLKSFGAADDKDLVNLILVAAEGPGMNQGVKREGAVYKSNTDSFSFKAISNSYLLAKGKKE